MATYAYTPKQRLRQVWRIPVMIAFFFLITILSPSGQHRNAVAVLLAMVVIGLPLFFRILLLTPVLDTDSKEIRASRFGISLGSLRWEKIARIDIFPPSPASGLKFYRPDSIGVDRNGRATVRIVLAEEAHKSFFSRLVKFGFSDAIIGYRELVGEIEHQLFCRRNTVSVRIYDLKSKAFILAPSDRDFLMPASKNW